jgi:hypothetical protein
MNGALGWLFAIAGYIILGIALAAVVLVIIGFFSYKRGR